MILMPIIMLSPILALLLFDYMPFAAALPTYLVILIIAAYYNKSMLWAMHAKHQTGVEAMIGKCALVKERIAPEGKVSIRGELWQAYARNGKIAEGEKVRITDVKGMVLIVSAQNQVETPQT